jgi:hypothetical protein
MTGRAVILATVFDQRLRYRQRGLSDIRAAALIFHLSGH